MLAVLRTALVLVVSVVIVGVCDRVESDEFIWSSGVCSSCVHCNGRGGVGTLDRVGYRVSTGGVAGFDIHADTNAVLMWSVLLVPLMMLVVLVV